VTSPARAAVHGPDRLPLLQHDLVPTPSLKLASMLVTLALDMQGLLVLDGPAGTGKTSAAVWLARQNPEWRWAYLQVPHTVRFDEVPAHVQEAITGHPARGKVRDIQRENVRLLREHHVAFIADEVQHAGAKGIQAVRYLADLTAMGPTGGTPILLVGHGSLSAASTAPEMLDRLVGTAEFACSAAERSWSSWRRCTPRLAVTPDDMIGRLDDECAGNGSLRSWHTIAKLLTRVSPNEPDDRPVTLPEVKRIAVFRRHLADARRSRR